MFPQASPLAALSLIVAPAILTNAVSVLIMGTVTRLGRTVDRATELMRELEGSRGAEDHEIHRRLRELAATERRSLMLLRTLRSFYLALSGLAAATLLALVAAVLELRGALPAAHVIEIAGIAGGAVAVTALVYGSILLVHETRLAVTVLRGRVRHARRRARSDAHPSD